MSITAIYRALSMFADRADTSVMRDESTAAPIARAYKTTASQRLTARIAGAVLIMVGLAPLLAHDHALKWWTPFVVLLGALFVYAPTRCGIYVTPTGLESKMFRRANTFRHGWGEVVGFDVVDNGFQCAVTVNLRDGTRKLLPSTRAWIYDNSSVQRIRAQLEEAREAGKPTVQR